MFLYALNKLEALEVADSSWINVVVWPLIDHLRIEFDLVINEFSSDLLLPGTFLY